MLGDCASLVGLERSDRCTSTTQRRRRAQTAIATRTSARVRSAGMDARCSLPRLTKAEPRIGRGGPANRSLLREAVDRRRSSQNSRDAGRNEGSQSPHLGGPGLDIHGRVPDMGIRTREPSLNPPMIVDESLLPARFRVDRRRTRRVDSFESRRSAPGRDRRLRFAARIGRLRPRHKSRALAIASAAVTLELPATATAEPVNDDFLGAIALNAAGVPMPATRSRRYQEDRTFKVR